MNLRAVDEVKENTLNEEQRRNKKDDSLPWLAWSLIELTDVEFQFCFYLTRILY